MQSLLERVQWTVLFSLTLSRSNAPSMEQTILSGNESAQVIPFRLSEVLLSCRMTMKNLQRRKYFKKDEEMNGNIKYSDFICRIGRKQNVMR